MLVCSYLCVHVHCESECYSAGRGQVLWHSGRTLFQHQQGMPSDQNHSRDKLNNLIIDLHRCLCFLRVICDISNTMNTIHRKPITSTCTLQSCTWLIILPFSRVVVLYTLLLPALNNALFSPPPPPPSAHIGHMSICLQAHWQYWSSG